MVEDENVVLLGADHRLDDRYAVLSKLHRYWDELRGTRLVPTRAEVDPRAIEDTLEYAFILERIAPGLGRFRLAGMHLNELMGMEVRGMPLTSFIEADQRRPVSDALEEVFSKPAIARLVLEGASQMGRPELEGQMLLLPMKSDLGDVSRVLGCLVTNGDIGRAPRRFSVSKTVVSPLMSDAAPNEDTTEAEPHYTPPEPAPRRTEGAGRRDVEIPRDVMDKLRLSQPSRPKVPLDENGRPILTVISND